MMSGSAVFSEQDALWMREALRLASQAEQQGEVPIGAVLVLNDEIIGEGFNRPISENDPTAHAEIIAVRQGAKRIVNYRILDATLYVTLEPCVMCMGALLHARVKCLVYGAKDPRVGVHAQLSQWVDTKKSNHAVDIVGGLLAEECGFLLTNFFQNKRAAKKNLSDHEDH
jgi:tRNA(adenine34) deaminase